MPVRKEHVKNVREVYVWKPYRQLVTEWGEELAQDLAKRHRDADPHMTGRFCKPQLAAYGDLYENGPSSRSNSFLHQGIPIFQSGRSRILVLMPVNML